MYLVWQLPDEDEVFARVANRLLVKELHTWSDRYQIPYNTKIFKGTRRVTFDNNEMYSFFQVTWKPSSHSMFSDWLFDYRLVEPMRIDKS